MSDDHSPGDARKPYSDQGGPAARHAQTHDVAREALTNPKGPVAVDPSFDEQLAPVGVGDAPGHADESRLATDDKRIINQLPDLSADELSRLTVLEPGVRLEQGGVYLDLNDRARGPFKALGGHEAEPGSRYVAKRDLDYDLWNRLAGADDDPEIERP